MVIGILNKLFSTLHRYRRRRLNQKHVRYVWDRYIGTRPKFFIRVVYNICKRDSAIRIRLMNLPEHVDELVICHVAEEMYGFFDVLVSQLRNVSAIKRLAYALGEKQAIQCKVEFDISFWSTFVLAFMEELERSDTFDRVHLNAFRDFLTIISDEMINGYFICKSERHDSQNATNSVKT
ncbi:unnamed protein product [Bursaphelenchus xylophilus]|uniref:(pine wood nematode) hypothetical protein n=1 Tax=Bursaphelenchus xylophilus TaxID=6326 RepID=A0A1I7SSG6_BURXY|nr:unnamed protein product [Bursaphelenchus xylophilus]CAG9097571.1 unnamed protein product [Bursaphelenchus xylophilus]